MAVRYADKIPITHVVHYAADIDISFLLKQDNVRNSKTRLPKIFLEAETMQNKE